ncbi:unnamed protein product [Staurois parvus]|uniref:Uncharacterized protein n=1 Tax=Staurois parvus TaxID=386267 RepID=A0ABN9DNL5_9NEOB|nr:unnamed protein product [Staurois parvus]
MQAGHRKKQHGQNVSEMSVFKIFKFVAGSGPRMSRRSQGPGTRKPDAGIGRRRWPGTLQGTHRGSEGQGKCCRKALSNTAW